MAEECERVGAKLAFVTEPLDSSPEGQLIQFVKGYAAKLEHAKIKERTLRGRLARVKSGKIHGVGSELYGYPRNRRLGVRLIHEAEASVVREIYNWVADEGSASEP